MREIYTIVKDSTIGMENYAEMMEEETRIFLSNHSYSGLGDAGVLYAIGISKIELLTLIDALSQEYNPIEVSEFNDIQEEAFNRIFDETIKTLYLYLVTFFTTNNPYNFTYNTVKDLKDFCWSKQIHAEVYEYDIILGW